MFIDRITYIATNWAAVNDDIITLDITAVRDGAAVGRTVISGHSLLLSGESFPLGVDADKLVVLATDLDFDGHVIDAGGIQNFVPRTGSITMRYEFDVRAMDLISAERPRLDPATGAMVAPAAPAAPAPAAAPSAVSGTIAKAGIGLGAVALVALAAVALTRKR